jgi:hypothetical protein
MSFSIETNAPITVDNVELVYQFGDSANIFAELKSSVKIDGSFINIFSENKAINVLPVNISDENTIDQSVNLSKLGIDPFTRVYYWFVLQYDGDQSFTSPSFWFDYVDNRFDWKFRQTEGIEIYWQTGDEIFVQSVYNTVKTSLQAVSEVLDAQIPTPLQIVIYPNANDLQSALQISGQQWIAGHANPEIGKVFISLQSGPNQLLELERQLPHELMHLAEYQIAGPSYLQQPAWLKEGLASSIELYPNPDYQRILDTAVENNSLAPFSQYCNEFPSESSGSYLAYAQSVSFVKYLQNLAGNDTLQNLILTYRNGMSCEQGFKAIYGVSLTEAEVNWKNETFGINENMFNLTGPWLPIILIGSLIIVIILLILIIRKKKKKENEY